MAPYSEGHADDVRAHPGTFVSMRVLGPLWLKCRKCLR
jgi:hypothetical protein